MIKQYINDYSMLTFYHMHLNNDKGWFIKIQYWYSNITFSEYFTLNYSINFKTISKC